MVDSANADQPCADCEQIAAWEATVQSDLRNAAATAEVCAADNGGSYVNCDTLASLEAYGFNKSPDVTFTSIMTTNDHWVSTSQNINVNGGSAYKYDSADGKIVPIPRSFLWLEVSGSNSPECVEVEFLELRPCGILRGWVRTLPKPAAMVSLSVKMKDPMMMIEAGPGVYFLESGAPVDGLVRLAEERGISVFRLDGHYISDKATFLREAAVSMHFPTYFGYNWDSFEECIRDLAWQPANGYVLLYDRFRSFAEGDPPHWETATEILRSVVTTGAGNTFPFMFYSGRKDGAHFSARNNGYSAAHLEGAFCELAL